MNAHELLDLFHRHAIGLVADGDTLRLKAPRGFLTPELRAALTRHKHELIAILAGREGQDAIPRRPASDAPLPLSYSQRQLWFLDQLAPGNPFYNNPAALGLHGPLDVAALEQALTEVVRRHEALRTVFESVDGEPRQVIRPAWPVALPVTDLSPLPEAERRDHARHAAEANARAPFDLAAGPLLRAGLLRLAEDEHHLLLNAHHIVADGWSMGLLVQEVAVGYAACLRGQPSPRPELPVQYADYALWQRDRLRGGELERQLAYWTGRLAGAPTLLALPTDRPRPAVQRFHGAYHTVAVDTEVVRGLRAVAQTAGATLFMALIAALSVLLWRYSGQDDVCVGTPFANRDRAELEGLVGHFINTVVVRNRVDPGRGFAALLTEVRGHVLDAYAHPDLPFDQLVEALRPERHTSHSPLFQVMLVMQNMPGVRVELPGLTLRALPTSTQAARFDLAVEAVERDVGLSLTFEYNTDLFDAGTVARMAGHFAGLLAQLAADLTRPVGDLDLLGPAERHRLVYEWNATATPPAGPANLVERFEAQVRARPDQPAVAGHGETLDYASLDRRASRLARALAARGAGPDQLVGLHVGRSPALVVGILGILKAGLAYLPLDPTAPPERLSAIVADAAPALVLTDAASPPDGWVALAVVEAEGQRDDLPGVLVHPANLAYVIYTSGSTGRPKGVAVTHGSVTNLLDHWLAQLGPVPGEPAMLWSSIGFDVSIQEIFLPLTSGGVLHLVPEELRADPEALTGWMRTHRIAQAYLPPAFVRWIDEAPGPRLAGLALRQLLVGVEPLSELGLHRAERARPGLRVLNGYGPTEATNYCTYYREPGPLARPCPIGRPLANTRVYLLDERGEPAPIGVPGEINVGGAGVARGYLSRPGLTAERFVPDPFVAGQRVYRTGDLARYLPDGNIEFLGRLDDQVKLRGFRIEPGEVEAVLRDEADVRDAAVMVDRDDAGEPRLVAAVSRGDAGPRLVSEWREILSPRLPGYMIPELFLEVPDLPRTPNGKLDRAALLARARAEARLRVNQASPRDQIELTLYQIWKRLLLHPDIGISDNFFDIGGTSISAIKLAHAVREEFGQTLPVRDIMLYPTMEALGGRLRHGTSGQPPSNLIEFRAGAGRERVICVHPAGGTGFCYLSLAKALPESCGVYGIQSPGVNPGEAFLPTVEAMAESYLQLTAHLHDGPVLLTGLSYGGLIAYEMGRRLAVSGHAELSVVLLDTLGTDNPVHRAAIFPVDLAEFRDKLVKFNGMYPGIDDRQIEQYFRIYNHNRLTMRDYLAPPGSARLVLLQATANRDEEFLREVREFWGRRAAGELAVEFTHRDHWEMLETDEVWRVAALLRGELDRFRPALSAPPAREA
jgi:amino acid adenylation domain-containing protein